MSLKSNFELMASYNHGMNENIYDVALRLSNHKLSENRGAFFGSILATLNHILVGDIIWLKRFANHAVQFKTLDYVRSLSKPSSLDTILYEDFDLLLKNRKHIDGIILEFATEITDEVLTSNLSYKNMKGEPLTQNLGHLIQHFFNHQTHHRGQVSALLSQAGVDVGVTDLLMNIPNKQL